MNDIFIGRILAGRSFLFVPGDRPERFDKALKAESDLIVLDLEDSVDPKRKEYARCAIAGWTENKREVIIRINAESSDWHSEDIALCSKIGVGAIMLPKSIPGPRLHCIANCYPVIPLIETANGVVGLESVAATSGVVRLAFGAIDLALNLHVDAQSTYFDSVRLQMVITSKAAGLGAPIDGVSRDFRNAAAVEEDVRRAVSMGFGGKLCIHPAQIAPTHAAFEPTEEKLALAHRIVEADRKSNGAAVSVDGLMIDRPVVQQAQLTLNRSRFAAEARDDPDTTNPFASAQRTHFRRKHEVGTRD